MTVNIVTKEDLQIFKEELFAEIASLFEARPVAQIKWLESYQVRDMLGISRGTLQNLRINGSLTHTKIGGLMFYKYEDIIKMMEKEKKDARPIVKRY